MKMWIYNNTDEDKYRKKNDQKEQVGSIKNSDDDKL